MKPSTNHSLRITPIEDARRGWRLRFKHKLLLALVLTTTGLGIPGFLTMRSWAREQGDRVAAHQLESTWMMFRHMLDSEYRKLEVAARLIARTPRVIATVSTGDPDTVAEEAESFREVGDNDLLVLTSPVGEILAEVPSVTSPAERRKAGSGLPGGDLWRRGDGIYLSATAEVGAGEELEGWLTLGTRIDDHLARELNALARVHLAFFSEKRVLATSLEAGSAREIASMIERDVAREGEEGELWIGGRRHRFQEGEIDSGSRDLTLRYLLLVDQGDLDEAIAAFEARLAVGGALFLLLVIFVSNQLANRLNRGLDKLVTAANAMAHENFDPDLDLPEDDEVGYLAHTMRELSRSVKRQVEKLQRINENLRGRIEEILFNETLGDHYTNVQILGKGGMGIVYRAMNTREGREVAIKILSPMLAEDPDLVERFLRESEILSRLDHPGVIKVYEAGKSRLPYCEMEYVPGISLDEQVKFEGPRTWREAVRTIDRLLAPLGYLHDNGITHRDVKPSNILIDDQDRVRLVDFGVAHDDLLSKLTGTGQMIGTPAYAAPEYLRTGHQDLRGDLYSTALVILYMLLGQHPDRREMQLSPSLASWLKDEGVMIPAEGTRVLETALADDPARRYANAPELAAALRAVGL